MASFMLWLLFTPGERHGANWIEGWVDPRTSSDIVKKRKILVPAGNCCEVFRIAFIFKMSGFTWVCVAMHQLRNTGIKMCIEGFAGFFISIEEND